MVLRVEAAHADAQYFRDNLERGNMKKCPQCRRLIEKMEGNGTTTTMGSIYSTSLRSVISD